MVAIAKVHGVDELYSEDDMLGSSGGSVMQEAKRRGVAVLAPVRGAMVPSGGALCAGLGAKRCGGNSADLAGRVGWQRFPASP